MNIEQMARECISEDWDDHVPGYYRSMNLERFAALVRAQALEDAARVCVTTGDVAADMYGFYTECISTAEMCAEAIRAIAAKPTQTPP